MEKPCLKKRKKREKERKEKRKREKAVCGRDLENAREHDEACLAFFLESDVGMDSYHVWENDCPACSLGRECELPVFLRNLTISVKPSMPEPARSFVCVSTFLPTPIPYIFGDSFIVLAFLSRLVLNSRAHTVLSEYYRHQNTPEQT